MTRERIYEIWAPPARRWSRWAKPVLFSFLGDGSAYRSQMTAAPELPAVDDAAVLAIPPADDRTALVVDLQGTRSASVGLQAAAKGYQPVPLFNSIPTPGVGGFGRVALKMWDLLGAIEMSAEVLEKLPIPQNAPPVFLLDLRRRRGDSDALLDPGAFDNRSISLPTDFPSANLLISQGISRIVLVLEPSAAVEKDLSHTLRRWQQAGIEMLVLHIGSAAVEPLSISRPSWFGSLWYGLFARMGFRRNLLGGYGGYLPMPSTG